MTADVLDLADWLLGQSLDSNIEHIVRGCRAEIEDDTLGSSSGWHLANMVLRQLAAPMADRPGYRSEWKPW